MRRKSSRRRAIKFISHTSSGCTGQCNVISGHLLRAAGLAILGIFLLSLGPLCALARATSDTRHTSTHAQHVVSADVGGASQMGTEAVPLFVKVEPPAKSPAEIAQDAKDRANKLASDQQTVDISRQLVWVGILQLAVFGFQAYKLQQTVKASAEQASDMKASIRESARAANAMEQVAMNSMRAAQHASESVTALKERTARQMCAYLSIDIGSAIYQERDKNLRFEGKALLRNAGHTPAYRVSHTCRAGILPMPLPDNFDLPQPTQPARGGGVIGPGQSRILSATIEEFVPDNEVDAIKTGTGRALYIWGRVTYEDAFGEARYTNYFQACCRRLRFDPGAEILVNRPIGDLILEWEAFTSSPPGSSTRRQLVQFGVGSNSRRSKNSALAASSSGSSPSSTSTSGISVSSSCMAFSYVIKAIIYHINRVFRV